MAKKNSKDSERRARIDQLRQEQARKERMRSMLILGVCVVAVLGLLAAALVPYFKDRNETKALASKSVAKIGVSEEAASCEAIKTTPTDENQTHIPSPTPIDYQDSPPSFGPHRPQSAPFERRFYTGADRPEIPELVHNLEHGYVILWYDESVADDQTQMRYIKAIADKFGDDDVRFIAAPWTSDDGDAFPDGKHIALTRWTADAKSPGDEKLQRGNWRYCGSTSGAVVSAFVAKWPNEESPEPGIM